MIRFILYSLLFLVAVWCGLKISTELGVATFTYGGWVMTMPLWFAFVSWLLGFLLLYCLLSLLRNIRKLGSRAHKWGQSRHIQKAARQTGQGLVDLAEGHWQSAEKLLLKAAPNQPTPLINYLAAARAAQEQGEYQRRDDYLRMAHESTPNSKIAVGLTQAQLQMSHHQLEHSLATLRHLQESSPHHPYVLKLLKHIYLDLEDWDSLLALIPELKKRKVITKEQATQLTIQVYRGLIQQAMKQNDEQKLQTTWGEIPRQLQKEKELVIPYANALIKQQDNAKAEQLIRDALKNQWDPELVDLYGEIQGANSNKQLQMAEGWLKHNGPSADLLLTLGRLCIRNQLWGKARDYLSGSIAISPQASTYTQLGLLLEYLKEPAAAMNAYRKAALLEQKQSIYPIKESGTYRQLIDE